MDGDSLLGIKESRMCLVRTGTLLGAPQLDFQDSEPKVSNLLSTLRQGLWANVGNTAPADQTHCLHLAAPGQRCCYTAASGGGLVLGPGQEGLSAATKPHPLGLDGLTLHCPPRALGPSSWEADLSLPQISMLISLLSGLGSFLARNAALARV